MRGPRNRPQESVDIITQHLAKLEITTDCAASDTHGASTPTTAFTEDKTPDDCRVELLRINLALTEPLEEQPANDMDPLPPRRFRQTTDLAPVTIEFCQFTAEPAPPIDPPHPPLGPQQVHKVP